MSSLHGLRDTTRPIHDQGRTPSNVTYARRRTYDIPRLKSFSDLRKTCYL